MKSPLKINGQFMPKPEGKQQCTLCQDEGKMVFFENWDLVAGHITIVHNRKGRSLEFYGGNIPLEILNHPDWETEN